MFDDNKCPCGYRRLSSHVLSSSVYLSDSIDVMCLALKQYPEGQKLGHVELRCRNALNYDSSASEKQTGCVYIMSQPDERLHLITA
jgi:hypothetical protein